MSDPDPLAEIKRRLFGLIEASKRTPVPTQGRDRILRAGTEQLLTDAAVLYDLADERGHEIARLRALLEPSVTMTSPHVTETPNDPPQSED